MRSDPRQPNGCRFYREPLPSSLPLIQFGQQNRRAARIEIGPVALLPVAGRAFGYRARLPG
jgi:hypothetical protein